jgi:hypothetical protein
VIKKYTDFLRLYEFHPGSEDPYTTISNKINNALAMGADPYAIKNMIKEILNHYKGWADQSKFHRQSDEYKYISLISDAIETSMDDGYPEELIFDELEKIYNQMK